MEGCESEQPKSQVQIAARLEMVENDGHFGNHKNLWHNVWGLKWINGRRIYYVYIPETSILILLGGNKIGQTKDIKQAEKILKN